MSRGYAKDERKSVDLYGKREACALALARVAIKFFIFALLFSACSHPLSSCQARSPTNKGEKQGMPGHKHV
jgi:hypothetical protein